MMAVRAGVVGSKERPDDELSGLDRSDRAAHLLDDAAILMPHRCRSSDGVDAAVGPKIRSAHASRSDPDDRVGRLHDRWRIAVLEANVAGAVKNSCLHRLSPCGHDDVSKLFAILLVGDLLHPVDVLAVEGFLYGNVGQCGRRRSAVPMLQARWKPHDVAWADFFDGTALALHPSQARGNDQGLAERMGVPCRPCAGFEGDLATAHPRRIWRLEQRIYPDRSGKPVWRPFGGGPRTVSFDFHIHI